jgi:hypothetical protein
LVVGVADDEAGLLLLDGPGRREAAKRHHRGVSAAIRSSRRALLACQSRRYRAVHDPAARIGLIAGHTDTAAIARNRPSRQEAAGEEARTTRLTPKLWEMTDMVRVAKNGRRKMTDTYTKVVLTVIPRPPTPQRRPDHKSPQVEAILPVERVPNLPAVAQATHAMSQTI